MNETVEPDIFAGRPVLFVMAAEAEYGRHLKERITPLISGVGPVEAAISLTSNLCALAGSDRLPSLIVSLGTAGSSVLEQARVYQVSDVSYRDMDASALGFEKGVTPFLDEPATLTLPYVVPGLPRASLSSGASVVSGFGYEGILAQMVDMETYAHLRATASFAIPMIGLRGISDGRAELTGIDDWTASLEELDAKLAEAVDKLAEAIEAEAIPV